MWQYDIFIFQSNAEHILIQRKSVQVTGDLKKRQRRALKDFEKISEK